MSFSSVPRDQLPHGIDALFNKTKAHLFREKNAGFLGNMLARVNFQWTRDMPTAAIGAKTLYWNPDFFMTCDVRSRVTILAHELWHNVFMHGSRLKDRCPDTYNIAGDHVINLMLKAHGYYMDGFPYVMDDRFEKMSTEQVYDILYKKGGKPQPNPLGHDVLPYKDDEDKAAAITNVIGAMAAGGISGGKNAGMLPGEITQFIDEFLNPKLPWQTLLFNYFNALTSQEYSFARPNRRYVDPIIPGITGHNGLEHLLYLVDISGSITDKQVVMMNSEVKYIQEELNPERLTLATFDTRIHDVYEFEKDDPFDEIEITGRGGTNLTRVYEFARKVAPTAMVIFTDLYVNIPPDPGIPIIWICVDNKKGKVPYGTLIHADTL